MNKFEYNKLTPFKWFVLENFPFIEEDFDALTEWQLFCKIGKEINKIINSQNTVGNEMEKLSQAFIELQNYINNYFDNLDVQEEINNKLNEMVESGELQELVNNIFQELTQKIDDFNYVNVKTLGAKGDGITDDTEIIKQAIAMNKPLYFPEGIYIISESIEITNPVNWLGQGNKTIFNSRPISDLYPNYVKPLFDFSSSNNIILKGFSSNNSTFKIYETPTENKTFKELMKNKYIYIENVTNDIENNNMVDKTNWQGIFINTPAPDNYTRDFHNGKYPRYGIQLFNNSGYNAIDIDNRIYDENGEYAIIQDNSAIGIVDGVLSSAPAFFIDMHGDRNAINIKNRTGKNSANSTSNPDSVFQVGYQGHLAIGCSVYSEDGALGVGTIKIKDKNPSIRYYDTDNPNNICVIRMLDNQFQFLVNGALRSYYESTGQHIYQAPLKIKPMAESKGGLILESTYANGGDYHFFVNDKGLPKMNRTNINVEQSNEAGYTIQYNMSGTTTNRPTSRLDDSWQTIGLMYFDTTLGKPIWWNGTNWVDANGTTV